MPHHNPQFGTMQYCCPGNTAMEVMETPEFNDLDGRVNTTVQRTC